MAADKNPVQVTADFLKAHAELRDVRWYSLLLFNAFDETLQMYLAWRLSCTEDALPSAAVNNASLLFDFTLAGLKDLRTKARAFAEARNAVAHHFHDGTYAEKLAAFVKSVGGKEWPSNEEEQLDVVADAAWTLSLEVGYAMQDVKPRPSTPFPHLTTEIKVARDVAKQSAAPVEHEG